MVIASGNLFSVRPARPRVFGGYFIESTLVRLLGSYLMVVDVSVSLSKHDPFVITRPCGCVPGV